MTAFCKQKKLYLVEDNCDALGSTYDGKKTGTFGDLATSSFYPPHHITMGEGGAVYTDDVLLKPYDRGRSAMQAYLRWEEALDTEGRSPHALIGAGGHRA